MAIERVDRQHPLLTVVTVTTMTTRDRTTRFGGGTARSGRMAPDLALQERRDRKSLHLHLDQLRKQEEHQVRQRLRQQRRLYKRWSMPRRG